MARTEGTSPPRDASESKEDRKAACQTFVEQTKVLVTLASAFVVAPAAVKAILDLRIDRWIIAAEILFIVSVLASYFALASVSGSQHKGKFDVYAWQVRTSGLVQFFSYLIGLCLFFYWLVGRTG